MLLKIYLRSNFIYNENLTRDEKYNYDTVFDDNCFYSIKSAMVN